MGTETPASAAPSSPQPEPTAPAAAPFRRPALLIALSVFVLVAIGAAAYWFFIGRNYEDTDDAYVDGRVITITPQVAGTVVTVGADTNDTVRAGQLLVRLDPADTRVALAAREAELAQAVRRTRSRFADNGALRAQVALRTAQLARAQDDLHRRNAVRGTGAISQEDLRHAELAVATARAALENAREQLRANLAYTRGTQVKTHPDVLAAAARVRAAYLDWKRARILAPVAGQIARRNVQVGQRVAPGTPIMALVPMRNLWVDANFKEVQITRMRIGQPVRLVADLYGSHVRYHGRIIGFAAGTGAAFALLPAQNATGNWIKVVQRVPVRIAIDPDELRAHPLRVGLSVRATVDVRDDRGPLISLHNPAALDDRTDVYAGVLHEADVLVTKIITENLVSR
ncbi:efflux pump membrane protein [Burkholderiales bacterium GJ-E10]|nr:efflux pump membrane protein [Burkholderiales bacterium GJ-E10]